ncbi:SRPBCC family protein [Leptolyngbya sp. AN02str]|uniref:SRPBCC family protein n=1 Tax=Leptolyngbya sp. AN02str TaxID=3423363 RepID=UPI003D314D6B
MFHFETNWIFAASAERLWQELVDLPNWPTWLADFRSVQVIESPVGAGSGIDSEMNVGTRYAITYRGSLPYSFRFVLEATSFEAPHRIELRSTGDLIGMGTWQIARTAEGCTATYIWQVTVANLFFQRLMVVPWLRSLAEQNHHRTMDRAYTALKRRLQG